MLGVKSLYLQTCQIYLGVLTVIHTCNVLTCVTLCLSSTVYDWINSIVHILCN